MKAAATLFLVGVGFILSGIIFSPLLSQATIFATQNKSAQLPALTGSRAKAMSNTPASGICPTASGTVIEVAISEIPAIRCYKVFEDQRIRVKNKTTSKLFVTLGGISFSMGPDDTYTIDTPLAHYLEKGIHYFSIKPLFPTPEIWLQ